MIEPGWYRYNSRWYVVVTKINAKQHHSTYINLDYNFRRMGRSGWGARTWRSAKQGTLRRDWLEPIRPHHKTLLGYMKWLTAGGNNV